MSCFNLKQCWLPQCKFRKVTLHMWMVFPGVHFINLIDKSTDSSKDFKCFDIILFAKLRKSSAFGDLSLQDLKNASRLVFTYSKSTLGKRTTTQIDGSKSRPLVQEKNKFEKQYTFTFVKHSCDNTLFLCHFFQKTVSVVSCCHSTYSYFKKRSYFVYINQYSSRWFAINLNMILLYKNFEDFLWFCWAMFLKWTQFLQWTENCINGWKHFFSVY